MKNAFVIVMCIQVLTMGVFKGGLMGELMKIPMLIEHFYDHNERGAISFMDFMEMHYMSSSSDDEDFPDDMKLPFKSSAAPGMSLSVTTVPGFQLEIFCAEPSDIAHNGYVSESGFSADAGDAVWQPPCL